MENLCVRVPKRLQEGLQIKARELNVKVSDVIREALWEKIQVLDPDLASSNGKISSNYAYNNEMKEQIYFIRSVVEHIGLEMDGGGPEFIDKCHLRKEKLLKNSR